MLKRTLTILKDTAHHFIASESLTRGAAIAFYSVTSLIPVLVIVIAIAGLAFGEDAARGAIVRELAALIGSDCENAPNNAPTPKVFERFDPI